MHSFFSNISFLPIVLLALVFNMTNTVGFTYADRKRGAAAAQGMAAAGMLGQLGGLGGTVVSGLRRLRTWYRLSCYQNHVDA